MSAGAARTPVWLKVAAVLLVAGWLLDIAFGLTEGTTLRAWSYTAERCFRGAMAFLVNLVVLAWCWKIPAGTVGVPESGRRLKIASALFGAVLAGLAGFTYWRTQALRSGDPAYEWIWLIVACGVAGGILGALLGARADPGKRVTVHSLP